MKIHYLIKRKNRRIFTRQYIVPAPGKSDLAEINAALPRMWNNVSHVSSKVYFTAVRGASLQAYKLEKTSLRVRPMHIYVAVLFSQMIILNV